MPLYRPTELQAFLASLGRDFKRTLSQNFLIDGNIVHKIIDSIDCRPGDEVVEIGPGPGVVTEALLAKGASVVAIELDRDFARALPRLDTSEQKKLTVLEKDVRHVILKDLLSHSAVLKIVSNIPYHLTKEILLSIAHLSRPFHAVLMVQEEVARKLTSKEKSLMVLELQLFGTVSYISFVPKRCFYPVPSVDSALISYCSHTPLIQDESMQEKFLFCLSKAYQQRRKSLVSVLSSSCSYDRGSLEKWLTERGFSSASRPDELCLADWVELFTHLNAQSLGNLS